MDIQVARFREVLELLKPAIPRKTNLPVLTHVLLKEGKAVATDLETMVIVTVPESDIDCLVPYDDVVKMIQYVQGLENLHIETTDGKVTMSWSDGKSTFLALDIHDYPDVPEFVPVAEAPMDIDTLIPAMYEVLAFAATDSTRPVLNAIMLSLGESLAVAAGDGYQMAYKSLALSFPQESIALLPLGSVTALRLLWEKTPRTPPSSDALVPIIMAKKHASVAIDGKEGLRFVFGDSTTAIVRLAQGNPPDWLKLMPKEEPVLQASLMGSQLELAVRRVFAVAMAGSKIVRMEFDDDMVRISAKHEGRETESAVKVLVSKGAPGHVGIDASYLLKYLKGKEGVVSLSWVTAGSPIAFNHQKSPTVLIMPMVVDWSDGTQKTEPAAEEAAEEPAGEPDEESDQEPAE